MRPLAPLGLSSLPQEFIASLPDFAIVVGLLALIWLACAVVATVGVYLAGMVFFAARWLVDICRRRIRRHWGPAYAHLVTIDSTGVRARPVTARRARRWHTPAPTVTTTVTDTATDASANREPGARDGVQPEVDHGPETEAGGESS